jgi:hypothetical protein
VPFLLFGSRFWKKVLNFNELVRFGAIAPGDAQLFQFVDTASQGWGVLKRAYSLKAA